MTIELLFSEVEISAVSKVIIIINHNLEHFEK